MSTDEPADDPWHCWCIFTKAADGGTPIELVVATDGPLLRFNKGAGDFWCNFLTPASTRGIQVELVQPF